MTTKCSMSRHGLISNLKEALRLEMQAVETYSEFYKTVKNKEDKRILEIIISEEREHVKIVEELIEMSDKFVEN